MFKNIQKKGPLKTVPNNNQLQKAERRELIKDDYISTYAISPVTFLADNTKVIAKNIMSLPLEIQAVANFNISTNDTLNNIPDDVLEKSHNINVDIQINNMISYLNSFTMQCFIKFIYSSKFIPLMYNTDVDSARRLAIRRMTSELESYINDQQYRTEIANILDILHSSNFDHSIAKAMDINDPDNADIEFMNTTASIMMSIGMQLLQKVSAVICSTVNHWVELKLNISNEDVFKKINSLSIKHPVNNVVDLQGFMNEGLYHELKNMIINNLEPNIEIMCNGYSYTLYYAYRDLIIDRQRG